MMRLFRLLSLASMWFALPAFAQAPGSDLSGVWLGTLTTLGGSLRLQLHLETGANGMVGCALDSLDQHAPQMACTLAVHGDQVAIEVPVLHGSWKGHSGADGQTLTGTWSQGGDLPLGFTRQGNALPVTR